METHERHDTHRESETKTMNISSQDLYKTTQETLRDEDIAPA